MEQLEALLGELSEHQARLVAVSKTKPNSAIQELYDKGQRIFGENRVQEMAAKQDALPKDIEWHMIGRLQSNKVKYIAPFVDLIHSVDSLRLLEEINKRALSHDRCIDCLLQFYIATEDSKQGFSYDEVEQFLPSEAFGNLKNIRICGVMGMASFSDDRELVQSEFVALKSIFDRLKTSYFQKEEHFKEISMGMSGDYQIALKSGSTLVRIGSLLFGSRNYT